MKRRKLADRVLPGAISVAMVTLVVTISAGLADTVTNQPVADAEIREFSPTSNFGTDTTMVSGGLGSSALNETRRALLRFDLTSQIPSQATINSVTLTVAVTKVSTLSPANSIFELRRLLQDWSEGGVTWNSRLSSQTPWSVPGAIGAADSSGAASSSVFVSGLNSYTFPSTPALVSDVQAWVNDPNNNFGWLLESRSESVLRTARHFASRESGAGAPILVVNFTAAISPPLRIDQALLAGNQFQFQFSAQAGQSYAVEFRASLASGSWQTLTNITAQPISANLTITDLISESSRFYRLLSP